mgnify:CR=1 FL=1
MLSIVIPTLNAEKTLTRTLAALVPAVTTGVVREVIIADGGSTDATEEIAEAAGCEWVSCTGGRGAQLARGAALSHRGDWLLFLDQDTVLEPGWSEELEQLVDRMQRVGRAHDMAAAYRLSYADIGWVPRLQERLHAAHALLLRRPTAAQGLVVARQLYTRVGGHREGVRRADADLARRVGRRRMFLMKTAATTKSSGRNVSLLRSLAGSFGIL